MQKFIGIKILTIVKSGGRPSMKNILAIALNS